MMGVLLMVLLNIWCISICVYILVVFVGIFGGLNIFNIMMGCCCSFDFFVFKILGGGESIVNRNIINFRLVWSFMKCLIL